MHLEDPAGMKRHRLLTALSVKADDQLTDTGIITRNSANAEVATIFDIFRLSTV
jgi:hypothetical protein